MRRLLLCLSLLLTFFTVAPAFAAARFVDNGDQTVTDTLTGLMWVKNANLYGTTMTWYDAFDYVDSLNYANGGAGTFGHNDWRDPTSDELMTLVDPSRSFPALPAGHPFSNVQSEEYWSSSAQASSYYYAYGVHMGLGSVYSGHKYNEGFVWPVRGVRNMSSASLTVSPASADFGTLPLNTASSRTFTLGNSGTANLVTSGISLSGSNSALFTIDAGSCGTLTPTILPGSSCAISVTFRPTTAGAKSATLRIASNDPLTPAKDLGLTGAGADTVAPVVTQFVVPATATGLTVPITSFVASDNIGVTGYCVSEALTAAGCGWTSTAPTQFTFGSASPPVKTVHPYVRDAAGNIGTGAPATVTVSGDRTGPVLAVSTLSDGSVTGNAVLNVSGTVSDESGVSQVTVNGFTVTLNADGSFSFPVQLRTGANSITTVARDSVGNSSVDTRSVTLQQSLPPLTISYPADNSTSNRNFLTVRGETGAYVPVSVSVNGNAMHYFVEIVGPQFSASVNLAAGMNTIEITATDLDGKKNTIKRTVVCNSQDPTINIATPAQDIQTTTASQTIYGTIADAITPVSVSVSDGTSTYNPVVSNGSFTQPLTLTTSRLYTVAVTVTEANTNQTTVRRNILFTKIDPGVRFADNGDQTVTDNTTGLTWTKNANLPNLDISWREALDYVAAMNSANGGAGTFGHNDWRLPEVEELETLVDPGKTNPALPAGHPFTGVESDEYWSSSVVPNKYAYVFGVEFYSGASYSGHDYNFGFVWPVRGMRTSSRYLPGSVTGDSYSQQLVAGWGAGPYTWSVASGSLPPGVALNSATGVLTGSATRSGVYSFTVRIADATSATELRPLALTVTDATCGNAAVRIAGSSTVYGDIADAYAHAADQAMIQLQALDFVSDLLFNRDIEVTLKGGYDCGYTGNSAAAGVVGNVRITAGTVKIEKLALR